MRKEFAASNIKYLLSKRLLHSKSSILAVCAGEAERGLFSELGFTNVTLLTLDPTLTIESAEPYNVIHANVMQMPYTNSQFDCVFVSDGLHHCDSPHRALTEMYRVASKIMIVQESRDSNLVRLASWLGFAQSYELDAVIDNGGACGGVNYTQIPNFVYRWTEREFQKTVLCANPSIIPTFDFRYHYNPPSCRISELGKRSWFNRLIRISGILAIPFFKIFPKQSNSFAMFAFKPDASQLQPWLRRLDDNVIFNMDYITKDNIK